MRAVLVVLMMVVYLATLAVAVSEMPVFGDPDNPVHNEVTARYIERGIEDTGVPNLVSAILVDYRAFDTLGEVTVLLTGITALLIVLSQRPDKGKDED